MMKFDGHIYLIGFMGVGKTSTSHRLSNKLGVEELDTDAMIVEQEGKNIPEIFADSGEEYFRQVETGILDKLSGMAPCVISCGGGLAMREINVKKMKESGIVVYLTAEPETIYEHVKDSTNRPLLNGNMNIPYIRGLMEERAPRYGAAADLIVKTDGLLPAEVAEKIITEIENQA